MTRDPKAPLGDDATELLVGELTAALHAERLVAREVRSGPSTPVSAAPPTPAGMSDGMPIGLSDRLIASGEREVRAQAFARRREAAQAVPAAPDVRGARRAWLWSGWLSAAAVLAMWAVGAGRVPSRTPDRVDGRVEGGVEATMPATRQQTVRALRDSLLVHDVAVTKLTWSTTNDSASLGASGDVVWSASQQAGVMRFAGLMPNDRRRWQYQLWIFDKRRDQRYPVDGGVFDIPSGGGDVLVPIHARVPVGEAVLFAVTVEAPGGVVVSTRERVALLANAGG